MKYSINNDGETIPEDFLQSYWRREVKKRGTAPNEETTADLNQTSSIFKTL